MDMIRVLFVCHGNICRSTMAEAVMKDMVGKAGLADRFYIESAATSTEEIGNPIYPPVRQLLTEKGVRYDRHKTARQMTRDDYQRFDYLIGMDEYNRRNMTRICGGDPDGKISLILDWTDHPRDVADPWYTDRFEATWNDVNAGCRALLKKMRF